MRNTAVSPRLRRHQLNGRDDVRAMILKTGVATAVVGLDGQILNANAPLADLVGSTCEHLETLHFDEIVSRAYPEADIEGFLMGRPAGGVVDELASDPLRGRVIRTKVAAADGSTHDVMLSYRVRTDDAGQPQSIFCQMRVTDHAVDRVIDRELDHDVVRAFEAIADIDLDVSMAIDLDGPIAVTGVAPAAATTGDSAAGSAGASDRAADEGADVTTARSTDGHTNDTAMHELLELNPNGVVIVDRHGRVLMHNETAVTLLATHADDLAHGRFPHAFDAPTPFDLDLRDATGRRCVVEVSSKVISWQDGSAHLVSLRDTTALSELSNEDDDPFLHDLLTGLPGRELFLNRLYESRRGSSATRSRDVAVAVVDLDSFRHVNEAHGRLVGDRVLQIVANRLTSVVRPGDYVARLGDDDFAILLQLADGDGAAHTEVATRVLEALSRPCDIDGLTIHCSPSVGIAMPVRGEDDAATLAAAQNALITGRTRGTSSVLVGEESPDITEEVVDRISRNLPMAVEEGQLFLHYQPVFDLTDSTISGLEALVRWEHPDDGLIAPNEFIRIADESGAIISLGEWILTEVADQIVEWRMRRPDALIPQVSINLTARQLLHPEFRTHVLAELARRSVSPTAIRFEITEKALVERTSRMAEVLQQLSEDGFAIDLDDFGTGLSSLTHLLEFPISSIKIDRSYINRLMDDEKSQVMVQAIIGVAKTFELKVVAEGIETADQKACLYRWGCDQAQGYLLARPLTPIEASRFFLREEASGPLNRSQGLLRRGTPASQSEVVFAQTYKSW